MTATYRKQTVSVTVLPAGQYQKRPLMWLYETWGLMTGDKWDKE